MTEYRLFTPNDTYRGTIEAETKAKALFKLHKQDQKQNNDFPIGGTDIDNFSLDYDDQFDAIIWPDDQTREQLGDVDDWRIEPVEESGE